MTIFKSLISASILAVLFVSCGDGDSKEKVIADSKSMMSEMTVILKTITDKASAEAAKPKLVELINKGKDLEVRIQTLNLDKKAINAEIGQDQETIQLMKGFVEELSRIKQIEDAYKVLESTMVKF